MYAKHDKFKVCGTPSCVYRVIWVSADRSSLAVVDEEQPSYWPRLLSDNEVSALVRQAVWEWIEGVAPSFPLDMELSEKHIRKRNDDWAVVRSMVTEHVPGVFYKMTRSKLILATMKSEGLTRPTVKKLLLRCFHGGMVRPAMLPHWSKCGAPGVERKVIEGSPKRGRPTRDGHPEGVNVSFEMRRCFAISRDLYRRNHKLTLGGAYRHCLRTFFAKEIEDIETGDSVLVPCPEFEKKGLPTFAQYSYWAEKDGDSEKTERQRLTTRVYEQKYRPMTGTSTAEAWGPCAKYQIDATVIDIYVNSRRDRNQLIGRPTLYIVVDVFSRMIVGLYIGLESPSWLAAMMALAHAITDKVAWCKSIGINIQEHHWPCHHIAAAVLGDRGEMEAAKIDTMLETWNVRIENASAYRGDFKGIVETRFNTLQSAMKPYVDGFVETDFMQRGARDYRADAVLDIDDLYYIFTKLILYYNNHHELKYYDIHPGMTQDRVPNVPIDIYNWGVAKLSGRPRSPSEDRFRFSLMPRALATMHPEGLYHDGRYYACQMAVDNGWYRRAHDKTFRVPISYDKRTTDTILVHDRNSECGFQVADLTERSRAQAGVTAWEAYGEKLTRDQMSAQTRDARLLARAKVDADIEGRNNAKAAEQTGARGGLRRQLSGLRAARADERELDRVSEAAEFLSAELPVTSDKPAKVFPLVQSESDQYARPSLRDRMRKEGVD